MYIGGQHLFEALFLLEDIWYAYINVCANIYQIYIYIYIYIYSKCNNDRIETFDKYHVHFFLNNIHKPVLCICVKAMTKKKTEKKQSLFDEFSKAFARKRLQNI